MVEVCLLFTYEGGGGGETVGLKCFFDSIRNKYESYLRLIEYPVQFETTHLMQMYREWPAIECLVVKVVRIQNS